MSNAGHVSGKVAVVTGAAHVRALAREGAIVAATDIIDDLGASLAEQLQSEGRGVSYFHHDVTSRAGWEAVVASVQQAHGPIDVLVNNAGVQVRSTGIEADDREWDLWERGGRTRVRVRAAGGKRPGPMLEYARYSRSSTRFSNMSESRSLLRISRSRPSDRVSSTAIRRELHAPTSRMVRDEPYSLGNGDAQRTNRGHIRLLRGIESDNPGQKDVSTLVRRDIPAVSGMLAGPATLG